MLTEALNKRGLKQTGSRYSPVPKIKMKQQRGCLQTETMFLFRDIKVLKKHSKADFLYPDYAENISGLLINISIKNLKSFDCFLVLNRKISTSGIRIG